MNRSEQIDALVADAAGKISALGGAAMDEVHEKQAEADASVARHGEASAELGEMEAEISRLMTEQEELPARTYQAAMDEDWDLEDRLKERYRNLKPALEALRGRSDELRDELALLSPRDSGHPQDVVRFQYGRVASVAHSRRRELEGLRDGVSKALDDALDPVAAVHENTRSLVWQMGEDAKWRDREVVA